MSISMAVISAAADVSGPAGRRPAAGGAVPSEELFCSVRWGRRTVSNGSRGRRRKTLDPTTNRRFEALSYLPPLSDESVAMEVGCILSKGWIPCLEFGEVGEEHMTNRRIPAYYDGRYWTLWKLPMFGCTDPPVPGSVSKHLLPASGLRQPAPVPVHGLCHPKTTPPNLEE